MAGDRGRRGARGGQEVLRSHRGQGRGYPRANGVSASGGSAPSKGGVAHISGDTRGARRARGAARRPLSPRETHKGGGFPPAAAAVRLANDAPTATPASREALKGVQPPPQWSYTDVAARQQWEHIRGELAHSLLQNLRRCGCLSSRRVLQLWKHHYQDLQVLVRPVLQHRRDEQSHGKVGLKARPGEMEDEALASFLATSATFYGSLIAEIIPDLQRFQFIPQLFSPGGGTGEATKSSALNHAATSLSANSTEATLNAQHTPPDALASFQARKFRSLKGLSLIYLNFGDLKRYWGVYIEAKRSLTCPVKSDGDDGTSQSPRESMTALGYANAFYLEAARQCPNQGKTWNQLSVVASVVGGDEMRRLFFRARSTICSIPFPGSEQLVLRLQEIAMTPLRSTAAQRFPMHRGANARGAARQAIQSSSAQFQSQANGALQLCVPEGFEGFTRSLCSALGALYENINLDSLHETIEEIGELLDDCLTPSDKINEAIATHLRYAVGCVICCTLHAIGGEAVKERGDVIFSRDFPVTMRTLQEDDAVSRALELLVCILRVMTEHLTSATSPLISPIFVGLYWLRSQPGLFNDECDVIGQLRKVRQRLSRRSDMLKNWLRNRNIAVPSSKDWNSDERKSLLENWLEADDCLLFGIVPTPLIFPAGGWVIRKQTELASAIVSPPLPRSPTSTHPPSPFLSKITSPSDTFPDQLQKLCVKQGTEKKEAGETKKGDPFLFWGLPSSLWAKGWEHEINESNETSKGMRTSVQGIPSAETSPAHEGLSPALWGGHTFATSLMAQMTSQEILMDSRDGDFYEEVEGDSPCFIEDDEAEEVGWVNAKNMANDLLDESSPGMSPKPSPLDLEGPITGRQQQCPSFTIPATVDTPTAADGDSLMHAFVASFSFKSSSPTEAAIPCPWPPLQANSTLLCPDEDIVALRALRLLVLLSDIPASFLPLSRNATNSSKKQNAGLSPDLTQNDQGKRKPIIIDGVNIIKHHGKSSLSAITFVSDWLHERRYDVIGWFPLTEMNLLNLKEAMNEAQINNLKANGVIDDILPENYLEDDLIDHACEKSIMILSNRKFHHSSSTPSEPIHHKQTSNEMRRQFIKENIMPYSFANDEFVGCPELRCRSDQLCPNPQGHLETPTEAFRREGRTSREKNGHYGGPYNGGTGRGGDEDALRSESAERDRIGALRGAGRGSRRGDHMYDRG